MFKISLSAARRADLQLAAIYRMFDKPKIDMISKVYRHLFRELAN